MSRARGIFRYLRLHEDPPDTARIVNEKGFKTGDGFAGDTYRGRLCSKGLWTEEPVRASVAC
jgi:hypothetical protein